MPTYNKQERDFLAKEIGETRINGTNGKTEYWSGDNYGWQSQNGYNEALAKEKARADSAIDKPLWDAVDQGTEAVGTFIASLPGVKEFGGAIHYVGEKLEETAANDAANGNGNSLANIAVNGASGWRQSVEWIGDGARTNYRAVESVVEGLTGVELDDRGRDRYAGAVKFAAEEIATVGAGKLASKAKDLIPPAPKPVMAAMTPDGTIQLTNLPDKPVRGGDVFETTIDQRRFGIPDVDYQDIHQKYPEVEVNAKKAFEKYDPNTPGGLRKMNEYLSRTPDFKRQPFDPVAYYKHIRGKGFDSDEFRRLDLESGRMMEQHHLFPVGESGPFMERMHQLKKAGIGDVDDPVAMMMYADFLGASMGHRWTNMLNMHKIPHLKVHAEDLIVESKQLREKLAKINNTNDLMQEMHNHIIDRIIPAKGKALDLQIQYLQDNPLLQPKLLEEAITLRKAFKKQIQPKQLSAIDDYIAALRARGSQ